MRLSFRGMLLVLLVGVLLFTAALVGGSANYNARYAVDQMTAQMAAQASTRMRQHVTSVLDAAEYQGRANRDLIENGTLPVDNPEGMVDFFVSALRAEERLTYISFGRADGAYWHAYRDPAGTLAVQWMLPNDGGGMDIVEYDVEDDGTFRETYRDENTERTRPYDRPYYIAAAEAGESVWPETYIFLGSQGTYDIPGLTRATPVYGDDGELLGVLTADFDLFALSRYLKRVLLRGEALAFIVESREDGTRRVIAHADAPENIELTVPSPDGKGRESQTVGDINDPRVRAFGERLPTEGSVSEAFTIVPFEVDGVPYFGGYLALGGEERPPWVLCMCIPESLIYGQIDAMNRTTLGISLAGVLLVILVSLWIARRLSRPLESIAMETQAIANFELTPNAIAHSPVREIDRLGEAMEEMKSGLRSFGKYVPSELVRTILASGNEAVLGGERKRITLYFSDIADFTSIAEALDPDALVALLAEYLDVMTREMLENGATVDKYIGDAIMAFWGAPHEVQDQALHACRTALANQRALAEVGRNWLSAGLPEVRMRIGLHTGEAIVGNFGSASRLDYTAIGDTVNLASRLEGLNKHYGTSILMSEDTYQEVAENVVARRIDKVAVKGRSGGTLVYELIGIGETVDADLIERATQYEGALDEYFEGRFEAAAEAFATIATDPNGDDAARVMAVRARAFAEDPPPEDWQGVFTAKSK